jgi:hypothetical protein
LSQKRKTIDDFARANDTSIECATAVFERAKATGRSVLQVWEDPSEDDTMFIIQKGFSLLSLETRLCILGRHKL